MYPKRKKKEIFDSKLFLGTSYFDQFDRKLTKHVEYIMLYYIATTTQRLIKYSYRLVNKVFYLILNLFSFFYLTSLTFRLFEPKEFTVTDV